jgi:hypothetical protein
MWQRRIGVLAAMFALLAPLAIGHSPGAAQAVGLWNCPFGGPSVPIDPNYVAYVKLFSLASSTPKFDVADTRIVINDTDNPATGTFTAQRSRTFTLTVTAGASASDLLGFLQVNVSASIQLQVSTSTTVATTGQVPPHSQLIGEYGIQAFDVVFNITTYQILAHVSCRAIGVQQSTAYAPTNNQGWRLRTG